MIRQREHLAAVFLIFHRPLTFAEQQCDAPQTCQTDKGIDDPAYDAVLSAEQPRNKIKLKNTHQTPVQAADDGEDQCNGIHVFTSIQYFGYP